MKKTKKIITLIAAVGAVMLSSANAATMISGEIFFSGGAEMKLNGALSTAALANEIDFLNPITVSTAISSGDYLGITPGTTSTFTDLTGAHKIGTVGTTGGLLVDPFWSFTDGATTYSFSIDTLNDNSFTSQRTIAGTGTAFITGFEPTPGTWELSTSGSGTTIQFSSSASVPDGGTTAALLGLTLLGFGGLKKFGSRKA